VLSAAFLNTDATRLDSCLGSFGAVVCAYVLINPAPAGVSSVRGGTGDHTCQESRSTGHRAARSVTVMRITLKHERRHPVL
jgi:hypothetical protein